MDQALVAILSVGATTLGVGVALAGLGWKVSGDIRREARKGHDEIGKNIQRVESKVDTLTGYVRGWLKQD